MSPLQRLLCYVMSAAIFTSEVPWSCPSRCIRWYWNSEVCICICNFVACHITPRHSLWHCILLQCTSCTCRVICISVALNAVSQPHQRSHLFMFGFGESGFVVESTKMCDVIACKLEHCKKFIIWITKIFNFWYIV